jgi:hypothetical protein
MSYPTYLPYVQRSKFEVTVTNSPRPSGSWEKRNSDRRCCTTRVGIWAIVIAIFLCLAIALGTGLGLGLKSKGASSSPAAPSSSSLAPSSSPPAPSSTPASGSNNTTPAGTWWKPSKGVSWQIVLAYALNDTSPNVDVYDIDLFLNNASTISALHDQGRKVMCYFSAGSYEDFRPDASSFLPTDYGNPLDGWPGEWWLNTTSANVRSIMLERIKRGADLGCDGMDPDNVDGYDNDTGFNLSENDAIDYLTFLASAVHSQDMAIGIKNAADIVKNVLDQMEWAVNEQCVEYSECAQFQPFIKSGKPVFHIEYPASAPHVTADEKAALCSDTQAQGFSSLLKDMALDNWFDAC